VRQSLIDLLNTSQQIAALSCKLCKLWQLTFIFEQRWTKLGYGHFFSWHCAEK
jgi:hypothetical protein